MKNAECKMKEGRAKLEVRNSECGMKAGLVLGRRDRENAGGAAFELRDNFSGHRAAASFLATLGRCPARQIDPVGFRKA